MSDNVICPNCNFEIEVTEVLSAQLRIQLQKEFEAEIRKKESAIEKREADVSRAREEVEKAQQDIDRRVSEQLAKERKQLSEEALVKAREQVTLEIQDKDQQLTDANTKLKAAQDAELTLRKERRELEEQKATLELTLTRRLDDERAKIRETAKKEAADERLLKDAEKDKLIADMNKQIDELKRKAEQGSQQSQGEVMELELESILPRHFPYDTFTPISKGVRGADVLQSVNDSTGKNCGSILWESKNAKNWGGDWLEKLRNDQRVAKAHFAILVTTELPKGVTTFNNIDGVWVTNWSCAIPLATALRASLIEVSKVSRAQDGKHGKMELMYAYLSGSEFRQRVEGIVEAFVGMKQDLEAEKRSQLRAWAKREKQLDKAISQTAGMYGDLQGIAGKSLQSIGGLEQPLLESEETQVKGETP